MYKRILVPVDGSAPSGAGLTQALGLARAVRRAASRGLKPECTMVENVSGRVADIVVDQARRWRADLIVMGTHGRRGVNRALLGSDAELVVRQAPVPVLLVRSGGRAAH